MWDLIEAILTGLASGPLGGTGKPTTPEPARPPRLALPTSILCAAGAAGSVYAMFFQDGDAWQIAKLLLLAALLGLCSAVAFLVFRDGRMRRRAALGLCRRCGYDLTGKSSGRCPECGLAIGGRPLTSPRRPASAPRNSRGSGP